MSQEFQPGQIVPETGTYKVIHVPAHAGALNLVTVIKGLRFPDWQCCEAVTFELAYSFEAHRRDTAAYGHTAREIRLSRKKRRGRQKRAVPLVARLKLITAISGRAIGRCLIWIAVSVRDTLSHKKRFPKSLLSGLGTTKRGRRRRAASAPARLGTSADRDADQGDEPHGAGGDKP